MRPKERRDSGQADLLRSRLDAIIDMDHALVKLSRTIDWSFLQERSARSARTSGPAAAADAADGRTCHPQAHLGPLRRGAVRALGGEPLLPILLRR
jgi:hypothetical protein